MSDFSCDIEKVDWSSFATAYGAADDSASFEQAFGAPDTVASLLRQLSGADPKAAIEASHKLWCALCHQHAYVSSAALPSYPVLVRILRMASPDLAVEILDILWGFAQCSAPEFGTDRTSRPDWMVELHDKMIADLDIYKSLAASEREGVRDFASWIVEELGKFS